MIGGIPRIQDCTSGYRCIKADLVARCDLSGLSTRGYSFQSSLLCELLSQGARPVELPIVFPNRIHGSSKLTLRDQIEFLINIGRIRLRRSKEFIKFCVVGLSGVFVNMFAYYMLTRSLRLPLAAASPIAIELSILSNFGLNSLWTFRSRATGDSQFHRLAKYHVVSSAAALAR